MTPDERVAAHVLKEFCRTLYGLGMGERERGIYEHLRECPATTARVVEKEDGRCSAGTCETLHIEAVMYCEHGKEWTYFHEESGTLAELIDELAEMTT